MGSEDVKFRMLKVLNEMLEVYARLLELIINIEEEEKRPIEEVIKETFSIESLSALALKLPPEVLGRLFAFILRFSSLFTIYRSIKTVFGRQEEVSERFEGSDGNVQRPT